MASIPAVGTRWRRKPPGREVVEVRRVWYGHGSGPGQCEHWLVRAQPVQGGDPFVADAHWFTTEGFRPIPRPARSETPR